MSQDSRNSTEIFVKRRVFKFKIMLKKKMNQHWVMILVIDMKQHAIQPSQINNVKLQASLLTFQLQ